MLNFLKNVKLNEAHFDPKGRNHSKKTFLTIKRSQKAKLRLRSCVPRFSATIEMLQSGRLDLFFQKTMKAFFFSNGQEKTFRPFWICKDPKGPKSFEIKYFPPTQEKKRKKQLKQKKNEMSGGQALGVKAQRFRGRTSPHRNVKEKKKKKKLKQKKK
eukprot:TRINITY_DN395_c0_g1_i11.p1 TRINITY_DN395_c0_g1~~TRINITY_DN395_c0_g1_i11.p1  ORF type:complete len:157 (-),score=17.13 TRINITY_DN395_c0_g1_i11:1-471(-)